MTHPHIKYLDQLLPLIEGKPEFAHGVREGYQFIDYMFLTDTTFEGDPLLLECRGIKFDTEGRIIARPHKKFFNLGEKVQPHEVDWTRPHTVVPKIDGSMIHPAMIDKDLVLMTRKGITDVALHAADLFLAQPRYFMMMADFLERGFTPIFEYIGPSNRIVLRYPKHELILTDIRDTYSGNSLGMEGLRQVAHQYQIPLAGGTTVDCPPVDDINEFILWVRALKELEGVVIRFEDGLMLKVKAEEYLTQHHALDGMGSKKKVVQLVLDGFTDDVLPILDVQDQDELNNFKMDLDAEVDTLAVNLANIVNKDGRGMDRKTFAITIANKIEPKWQAGLLFNILDGQHPWEVVRKHLRKNKNCIMTEWRGE